MSDKRNISLTSKLILKLDGELDVQTSMPKRNNVMDLTEIPEVKPIDMEGGNFHETIKEIIGVMEYTANRNPEKKVSYEIVLKGEYTK